MIYIAIDPGLKGGWAIQYEDGTVQAYPMPVFGKEIDIAEIVDEVFPRKAKVFIERVASRPGQGAPSVFKFGTGYGQLIGMCQALKWSYELIRPQEWKKILIGTKKDKDAAIRFVRQTYPNINLVLESCRKPHDGMADALCLLTYGLKN